MGSLAVILALVGCSDDQPKTASKEALTQEQPEAVPASSTPTPNSVTPTEAQETKKEDPKKEDPKEEESKVDTTVFVYAESVDVTDARDITQHIDIVVHMSNELTPGLATQHVFTQAYDFLQQKDIQGTKTVTIGVMQGDLRISQITIDVSKFKAGEHLVKSVLDASTIDKMNDDVKEFGKVMNLW